MKDFNFFSPYLLEKRNKRQTKNYIILVSSLIAIGLLAFSALNYYQIARYKNEINTIESYLNSNKTKELLSKYEETEKNKELLEEYYNKVSEIDKILSAKNVVRTQLFDKLSSTMPQDTKLLNLVISNGDIEMRYLVGSMVTTAELEHNLKELDIFDWVHVSIINNEADKTAIISCSLKDVKTIEAETD